MVLVKLLKRRDGATIVVGVVLGLLTTDLIGSITSNLANRLSVPHTQMANWHNAYLFPVVQYILELIALEILCWIYVWSIPRGNR